MNIDLSCIGLSMIRRITDLWAGARADSLIDYTRAARVEPIVLIDADCLYLESLPEVQQSLLHIFAGYYMQAIALSCSVGKIEVHRHLDKLNPSRNPIDSAADTAGWIMAQENYKHRLPMPGNKLAMEADQEQAEMAYGKDTLRDMREAVNLSVGKMFSVEITDGMHKAAISIAIRLMANSVPSNSLVHILSHGSEDTSMKARYHAWRAGRIEFVKDLCFAQDLIDAHRKNLMADKDGIYAQILQRSRKNQLATLVSGNPSVSTASNMVVISDTTAAALELEVNGRLKDFSTREKIFKNTYLMIMVVIDKQFERVTIYHRGLHSVTEVGVRDLKAANKGSGPDVSDILKAYQLGNSPSL